MKYTEDTRNQRTVFSFLKNLSMENKIIFVEVFTQSIFYLFSLIQSLALQQELLLFARSTPTFPTRIKEVQWTQGENSITSNIRTFK
jgi:hypothetical protein